MRQSKKQQQVIDEHQDHRSAAQQVKVCAVRRGLTSMRSRRRISIASSPRAAVSNLEERPQNVWAFLVVDDRHGAVVVGRRLGRHAFRAHRKASFASASTFYNCLLTAAAASGAWGLRLGDRCARWTLPNRRETPFRATVNRLRRVGHRDLRCLVIGQLLTRMQLSKTFGERSTNLSHKGCVLANRDAVAIDVGILSCVCAAKTPLFKIC